MGTRISLTERIDVFVEEPFILAYVASYPSVGRMDCDDLHAHLAGLPVDLTGLWERVIEECNG